MSHLISQPNHFFFLNNFIDVGDLVGEDSELDRYLDCALQYLEDPPFTKLDPESGLMKHTSWDEEAASIKEEIKAIALRSITTGVLERARASYWDYI